MDWDAVVLGAGIAGLAAAHNFTKRGKTVLVLEKSDKPGGALRSTKINGYYVDNFYHHLYPDHELTKKLCKELNVPIDWINISSGFYDGKYYTLNTPVDLLSFKLLNWKERLALIRLLLKIRITRNTEKYDNMKAEEFLTKYGSKEIHEKIFKHMLQAKLGCELGRTSATWIIERLKERIKRSIRGEKLGYVRGGFHNLTNALVREISKIGKVECNATVKKIKFNKNNAEIIYDKQKINAKKVIATIPPRALLKITKLPADYAQKLNKIEFQGACNVLIALDKQLTPHYWTNMMKKACFGAIVEQTNFTSPKKGEHLVYLSSYPDRKSKILNMTDKQIAKTYLEDFEKLFGKHKILWHKTFKTPIATLVYSTGIKKELLPVKTPIPNLYIAGLLNSYPERGIERTLKLAQEIR